MAALICWGLMSVCGAQTPPIYNVIDYGATGNGTTLDSPAINNAIAAASNAGGGTVEFPAGTYLCESIHLLSNVTLYLDAGSTIEGASSGYDPIEPTAYASYEDFGHAYFHDALIWGQYLSNIGIVGSGTITGNGNLSTNLASGSYSIGQADKVLALKYCNNVTLSGITITKGGHFGILANGTNNMYVDGIQLLCSNTSVSRDAFDLISSSHVHVTNSNIQGSDDAMCLKSDYALGATINSSDICVDSNAIISTENNATQFGSETVGNFTDVDFLNLVITGAGKAGIGITTNDGSDIDGVTYDNLTMSNCATPIFMHISNRGSAPGPPPVGQIKNISINDVTSTHSSEFNRALTSTLMGYPGATGFPVVDVQNVVLNNVSVSNIGGITTTSNPADISGYAPENISSFPGYGWFLRYVNGISYNNNCQTHLDSPDGRPAIYSAPAPGGTNISQNIKFDSFTCDPNLTDSNSSTGSDVLLSRVTGYQFTNSTETGGASLQISTTNSTSSSICFPPFFNAPGGIYTTSQSVQLTSATPGASIYYTTDDSLPSSTNGTLYSTPISITSNNTIVKAIATCSGLTNSAVNTAIYRISTVLASPTFFPAAGSYTGPQTIVISSLNALTDGATIMYTTDGTTPSPTHGIVYTGPITLGVSATIQAMVCANNFPNSPVVNASYTIAPALPAALVFQADLLPYTASGALTGIQTDSNITGGWMALEANTDGTPAPFIDYSIPDTTYPTIPAGTYKIALTYKTNADRGILQMAVDGTSVGSPLSQYIASGNTYPTQNMGSVTFQTSGSHNIQLTVTGKNSNSTAYWLSATTFTLTPTAVPPMVTPLSDQIINENGNTVPLTLSIGDMQIPASSLTITAASSNTTLIPNANIVIGGSGANRTVTVTPASGQFGTATITVTVSDGTFSTVETFQVTTLSPIQQWRYQYFAPTYANTGEAADTSNPTND
ncbi:MAG TPA: chitobiase/beta-hexosaminidase C-terminal domain-containing protein, partial [Candidatus Methylacidiphilales bacterium]|nr:chitobiase/beta-hexosaminidase C-terminal domain-containing protein [Candidatus Methylacidiphilales bacterium]